MLRCVLDVIVVAPNIFTATTHSAEAHISFVVSWTKPRDRFLTWSGFFVLPELLLCHTVCLSNQVKFNQRNLTIASKFRDIDVPKCVIVTSHTKLLWKLFVLGVSSNTYLAFLSLKILDSKSNPI